MGNLIGKKKSRKPVEVNQKIEKIGELLNKAAAPEQEKAEESQMAKKVSFKTPADSKSKEAKEERPKSKVVEKPKESPIKDGNEKILFKYQKDLPHLPVPELQLTCSKLLRTLKPLINETEMKELQKLVADFEVNEGVKLQEQLIKYAKTQENYIEAFWSDAYLMDTEPSPINVNPFFMLENDPRPEFQDQVRRTSSLIMATLKFIRSVRLETMEPDLVRGKPLSMDQFPYLFNTARIPTEKPGTADRLERNIKSTHIVVLCCNQIYYFDVILENATISITEVDLIFNLSSIIRNANETKHGLADNESICVLTTQKRGIWANVRNNIIKVSADNEKGIKLIDSALFVVCLDQISPTTMNEMADNLLHGENKLDKSKKQQGTCLSRWFDKLQIIVCQNGRAGINFEHSPCDGHTVLRFVSDIFTDTLIKYAQSISGASSVESRLKSVRLDKKKSGKNTEVRKLRFTLNDEIKAGISSAIQHWYGMISKNKLMVLEFTDYGKNAIIENNLSPDAFTQIAMMMAYYKMNKRKDMPNTYESVMTKSFKNGRTEAGRSATPEALDYFHKYHDSTVDDDDKVEALRVAAKAHSQMTFDCSKAHGVDRHLYALKTLNGLADDVAMSPLFSCDAYKRLGSIDLSTSNCGNPALKLFGYGPVSEHGIGCGYIIKPHGLSFCITTKQCDPHLYKSTLEKYLKEVMVLLTKKQSSRSREKSKSVAYKRIESLTPRLGERI